MPPDAKRRPGWEPDGAQKSLTDHPNGTTDLDEVEARDVTNKIRQNLAVALVHIKKAWAGRAWLAMGYSSWSDYCSGEFDEYVKLGRDARQEIVLELREVGMSTRAIGAAIGTSEATVRNDIRAGAQSCAPDDPEVVAPDEIIASEIPNNVIGLDGKTYKPKAKPKGKPIIPDRNPIFKGQRHARSADVFRRIFQQIENIATQPVFDDVHLDDDAIDAEDLDQALHALAEMASTVRRMRRAVVTERDRRAREVTS